MYSRNSYFQKLGRGLASAKPSIKPESVVKTWMQGSENLTVSRMGSHDLHYVMQNWALDEGWFPTQYTVEPFLAAAKNGYYLLFRDNEPIASLAAVDYAVQKTVFIGLYIVIPEYRKKGYGKQLWDVVTKPWLDKGYILGLDATMPNIPFYEKSGFEYICSDEIWVRPGEKVTEHLEPEKNDDISVHAIDENSVEQVCSYDQIILEGDDRAPFLKDWIFKPETYAFVALNKSGDVLGYGVLSARVSPDPQKPAGYRIGPLYANNSNVAENLLSSLVKCTPNSSVVLDIPGKNSNHASQVAAKFGFFKCFELANMYTKKPVDQLAEQRVYAKSSLAIATR